MKFADPREQSESLCFKPTTQRNLKHKALSVRALVIFPIQLPMYISWADEAIETNHLIQGLKRRHLMT